MENCKGCAYAKGDDCKVMKQQYNDCWNNTTPEEAKHKETDIKHYEKAYQPLDKGGQPWTST